MFPFVDSIEVDFFAFFVVDLDGVAFDVFVHFFVFFVSFDCISFAYHFFGSFVDFVFCFIFSGVTFFIYDLFHANFFVHFHTLDVGILNYIGVI